MDSLFIKYIFGKEAKSYRTGLMNPGRGYNNMNHTDKYFEFPSIHYAISRSVSILITNVGLIEFSERIKFSRTKDGTYVINLNEKHSKGTH